MRAHLTLHDQRHGARMDAFDRVFQGDDIELPGGIEMVQHRRQGRRFSRPGGPGHQDQALVHLHELLHNRGQP